MPKVVLYYHPSRELNAFNNVKVYHDSFKNDNQDPYLWNDQFLHSFCHITQSSNDIEQINFWVSSDETRKKMNKLYCDLVFVISEKHFWNHKNSIDRNEHFIDNDYCYDEHYNKFGCHLFKRKKRYSLKADPIKSFQPQDNDRNLMDILPFLNSLGILTETLQEGMKAGFNSKPYKLNDNVTSELYKYLDQSQIKLIGRDLKKLRFE